MTERPHSSRAKEEDQAFDEQALLAEYEVEPAQCAAELAELLDEMVARGLVRVAGSGSGSILGRLI